MNDLNDFRTIEALFQGIGGDARNPGSAMAAHMASLHVLARHWGTGHIVELGVGWGYSTVALLSGAWAAGRPLISYDTFQCPSRAEFARARGVSTGHPAWNSWEFRRRDSVHGASDFPDGSVSLLFIDTSHTLEHTRQELAVWGAKMHPRGIMCGHDYYLLRYGVRNEIICGVRQAVHEVYDRNEGRMRLQVEPHNEGLWILWPRSDPSDPPIRSVFKAMEGGANIYGSGIAAHLPALATLAGAYSFAEVVELGAGFSTVALLAGLAGTGRRLRSYDVRNEQEILVRLGHAEWIDQSRWMFIKKRSIDAAADLPDGAVSFLFLDTTHFLDDTRRELAAWLPKMHPMGVMCGHDYSAPGVRPVVDATAISRKDRFSLQVLPHDNELWILWPKRLAEGKGS